jgi:hypothetical protein
MESSSVLITIARDGSLFTLLALPIALAGLLQGIFIFFNKTPFSSKSASKKFFKSLDKKFDLGLIKDKDDIVILAESYRRQEVARYELGPLLEDYLRYLSESSEIKNEQIPNRYRLVKDILEVENQEKPFSDVPEEERRILQALRVSIESNNEESANENLEDLRLLIATRYKTYVRNSRLNRWSVPLAVFGLLATLIFGFMSLKDTVDYNKIDGIMTKHVEIIGARDTIEPESENN